MADALVRHGNSRFPVRLVGFPAYTYFFASANGGSGTSRSRYAPAPRSCWGRLEAFYTQQVDKPVLYDLVKTGTGLDNRDIIEVFSAVEHPILYADCVAHHFHIPIYSRAIIRDVNTLEPLPPRPGGAGGAHHSAG